MFTKTQFNGEGFPRILMHMSDGKNTKTETICTVKFKLVTCGTNGRDYFPQKSLDSDWDVIRNFGMMDLSSRKLRWNWYSACSRVADKQKARPYEKFSSKDGFCLLFLSAAFSIIETRKKKNLLFASLFVCFVSIKRLMAKREEFITFIA